jgi:hypothetical protein
MVSIQTGVAKTDPKTGLIEIGRHVPFEHVLKRYEGQKVKVTITEIP